MKLNIPISVVLENHANGVAIASNMSITSNYTTTFSDLQSKLLNTLHSTVKASDVSLDGFIELIEEPFGTIFNTQREFMHAVDKELKIPSARISVSSPRQAGTTTALMMLAYYHMLSNPHQHIVFLYPSKQLADHVKRQFCEMVAVIQDNSNIPPIFSSTTGRTLTTQVGGRVTFLTSNSPELHNLRGLSIGKLIVEHPSYSRNRDIYRDIDVVAAATQCDVVLSDNGHALSQSNSYTQIDRESVKLYG